jgi:hypothetical protein
MAPIFDSDLFELFRKQANFKDLSEAYFATSSVPLEWVSKELAKRRRGEMLRVLGETLAGVYRLAEKPSVKPKGMLTSLADFLTEEGPEQRRCPSYLNGPRGAVFRIRGELVRIHDIPPRAPAGG